MFNNIAIWLLILLVVSCNQPNRTTSEQESQETSQSLNYDSLAQVIAQETIILDGHVDLSYRLLQHREDITQTTQYGNFDLPRARKGGLNAPFISIFVPTAYENKGAKRYASNQIYGIKQITKKYPQHFDIATSPQEVKEDFEQGLISFPLGIENGAPIEGDLSNVRFFYDLSVRYITLCHVKDNHICDAATGGSPKWNGLSPFGEKLILEMNQVGMMIDISHASDQSAHDVLDISSKPIIASHSGCRHFTPGFARNLPDNFIKRIGENEGIIMVNFGSYFLKPSTQQAYKAINRWRLNKGLSMYDQEILDYAKNQQDSFGSVGNVVDHIDHVVKIAGIDHVGFGSDYDGIGWVLPEGLRYVDGYPLIIAELLKRGYSRQEIEKICYQNFFRVWESQR